MRNANSGPVHDLNGNRLTVGDGTLTLTATYDRLNRVLTVDDEDAGTSADTSYTYSFTSPAWTDVTGSYAGSLDKFERPTMVNDPASSTNYIWSYGTGGQVLSGVQGNDNTVTNTYDAAGRMLTSLVKDGGTNRAAYTYTYNRAGQVLSETADVGTDPADGTVSYAYDPLGRLTGSTLSGTTTAYAWGQVPLPTPAGGTGRAAGFLNTWTGQVRCRSRAAAPIAVSTQQPPLRRHLDQRIWWPTVPATTRARRASRFGLRRVPCDNPAVTSDRTGSNGRRPRGQSAGRPLAASSGEPNAP